MLRRAFQGLLVDNSSGECFGNVDKLDRLQSINFDCRCSGSGRTGLKFPVVLGNSFAVGRLVGKRDIVGAFSHMMDPGIKNY